MAVALMVGLSAALNKIAGEGCVDMTAMGGGAFYTAPLGVGTPAQLLDVIPDTGSYDLLLDSSFCTDNGCDLHVQYDPGNSTTSLSQGKATVSTAYGQGTVQSTQWEDTVTLGTLTATSADMLLMVSQQARTDGAPLATLGRSAPFSNLSRVRACGRVILAD